MNDLRINKIKERLYDVSEDGQLEFDANSASDIEYLLREVELMHRVIIAATAVNQWFWNDGPSTDSAYKFTALKDSLDKLRGYENHG